MKEKATRAQKESDKFRKGTDKLNATIEKQKGVMQDLRKQINDRDRRLSIVAHEKNDTESMLTKQLEDDTILSDYNVQKKNQHYIFLLIYCQLKF